MGEDARMAAARAAVTASGKTGRPVDAKVAQLAARRPVIAPTRKQPGVSAGQWAAWVLAGWALITVCLAVAVVVLALLLASQN